MARQKTLIKSSRLADRAVRALPLAWCFARWHAEQVRFASARRGKPCLLLDTLAQAIKNGACAAQQ
eukprot:6554483-Alexandrium_andersonii.AAC.1